MSAITIDNNLVHYEVLGRGRPVILLHGWLGSWRYWIPTMQQLSVKYRIYALDLWGFGDTDKEPTRYSFAAQVKLLTDFMDKLGIAKAAIVGHSLGAAVGITFARQFAERVPRVMLISPPLADLGTLDTPVPLPASLSAPAVKPAALSSDPAATLLRNPLLNRDATSIPSPRPIQTASLNPPQPVVRQGASNPLVALLSTLNARAMLERQMGRDAENYEKLRVEVEKMDPAYPSRSASSFVGIDLAAQLKQLTNPVLLLHGRDDTFIEPNDDVIARIAKNKPDNLFVPFIVPNFHHFPMLEHAARFNRLLGDFLDAPDLSNVQMKEQWKRQLR